MAKQEIQAAIDNSLAKIIGGIALTEISLKRIREGLEKHGAEDYGTSLHDAIENLTTANRQLGKLSGMVVALELFDE